MNMNLKKTVVLTLALIFLAGCTMPGATKKTARPDGGAWKSIDAGKSFAQAVEVPTTKGRIASIANLDVNKLVFDPQDPSVIYLASQTNGLFYSLDGGATWLQFKTLNNGYIQDIAVDANNKCVFYVTTSNRLFKTENCGRDFSNVYYHQKSQVLLTAMSLDANNSQYLYLGTSEGEVLKSVDAGLSWTTAYRQSNDSIMDIIVDPYDGRIVYVATGKNYLVKSVNGGESWLPFATSLKTFSGSKDYIKMVYDQATPNGLILISKFGLLRSFDGANSWQAIDLLPANKKTTLLAVAVNPKNSNEIYYATESTLVKTNDSGVTWSSRQLPYKRATTGIMIDPVNPNNVYLVNKINK